MANTVTKPTVNVSASIYWQRTEEEQVEWDEWCRLHDIPIGLRRSIVFVPEGPVQVTAALSGVTEPDETYEVNMKAMPPAWVLGLWRKD